ncbi:MAG TPA: peptidylprolyl isomerase [Kineosporiaceae bacterium]
MSPISREREYQRRRYQKWQTKLAEKQARQRRQRRRVLIAGSAVAVVLVVSGTVLWVTGRGSDEKASTALSSASPSTSGSGSASASAPGASGSPAATAGPNPCPRPTVTPPAKPQSFGAAPDASLAQGKTWTWTIKTTCGDLVATLDGTKAPKAVANAIFLSGKQFWDGSPCHRLSTTGGLLMLQCGDPTGSGTGGPGYSFGPIENAPQSGGYTRGMIAMANTGQPNSQGSQFFVVFGTSNLPPSYTVFGTVTKGLDVIDKVAAGGISAEGAAGGGPPNRPISIVSTSVTPG